MAGPFSVILFLANGDYGWSEQHFLSGNGNTIDSALSKGIAIAPYRAALLGSGASVNEVRVSDFTIFRDSFINEFNPPLHSGNQKVSKITAGGVLVPAALAPFYVLLCRGESGSQFRKSLYLGGIPNIYGLNTDSEMNQENATYKDRWDAAFGYILASEQPPVSAGYAGALFQNGFGFMTRNRDGIGRAFKRATAKSALTSDAVSGVTVTFPGTGYTAIPQVSFRGGGGTGALAVATIDLNGHVTGVNIIAGGSGYTSMPKVFIAPPGFTWKPYTNIKTQHVTHRKRGRVFDQPAGKSKQKAGK